MWPWAIAMLGAVAACYTAPASDPTCGIECTESCPGDLTCTHGLCVADGQTCAPVFAHVRAGNAFACGLDAEHKLWCWGANTHHQIDPAGGAHVDVATAVGDDNWDDVATGGGQICGLRDGELSCWGANDRGQVTGAVAGDVVAPYAIEATPPVARWTAVAAGFDETCAIGDGRLLCWGANTNGQLGNGSVTDIGVPTAIASPLTDWTTVAVGPDHACAISLSMGLFCWGNDASGQLGDNAAIAQHAPVAISLPGATQVTVGLATTCAVTDTHQLYCWGDATHGDLGDPSLPPPVPPATTSMPTLASGFDGWTAVSAAERLTCALRGDEVWCWGTSVGGGGLGNGVWSSAAGFGHLVDGASDLAVGWNANFDDEESCSGVPGPCDTGDLDLGCIVAADAIQCWGNNDWGELGQGASTMQVTPGEIAGGHLWRTLAAGATHACGIDMAGVPYCWGSTLQGQATGVIAGTTIIPCGDDASRACDVGVPTALPFLPTADALALGETHSCALAGTAVTCWGDNTLDQLGTVNAPGPAPLAVSGAYTDLYAPDGDMGCGQRGGETWCWGATLDGLTAPVHEAEFDGIAELHTYHQVGTSHAHGCALDANRQLVCYGDDLRGQFGNGAPGACGDGLCNVGESAAACPQDCPTDTTTCGDGTCTGAETAATCPQDCGAGPLTALGRTYAAFTIGQPTRSSSTTLCGVRDDGHVECWGKTSNGQAGVLLPPVNGRAPPQYTPFEIANLTGCTAVSASDLHTCAICNGQVSCWGDNRHGGVGAGAITANPITVARAVEMPMVAGDAPVQLVSGVGFTCARTAMGHAYCWGSSPHGGLGAGAVGANRPMPIRAATH